MSSTFMAAAMDATSPPKVKLKNMSSKIFMTSALPTMHEMGKPLPIALPKQARVRSYAEPLLRSSEPEMKPAADLVEDEQRSVLVRQFFTPSRKPIAGG
jgi:hypothetical protein